VFNGQKVTLHSRAEGKYLNYQWHRNGQPIAGANKKKYEIEDVNGTQHDGNYTLVVSNDFGSVTTQPTSRGGWYSDKPHRGFDQYGYDLLPAGHFYDGQSDQ